MERKALFGFFIIIMALGATILIGFALNVEQSTETKTDYDLVTDVTGLYEFTDQEQYIDYTPPSNYNGYIKKNVTDTQSFTNSTNTPKFSIMNTTINATFTSSKITVNGIDIAKSGTQAIFFAKNTWGWSNGTTYAIHHNGAYYEVSNFTLTYNGTTLNVRFNNTDHTSSTDFVGICDNNGNYGWRWGGDNAYFYTNNDQIYRTYDSQNNITITARGNTYYTNGTARTGSLLDVITESGYTDVYKIASKKNLSYSGYNFSGGMVFAPIEIIGNKTTNIGPGIAYTESATANNYPIGTASSTTTGTATLTGSLPQQTPQGSYAIGLGITNPDQQLRRTYYFLENPNVTTVTNLINSLNIPSGVTEVKITTDSSVFNAPNAKYYTSSVVFFNEWSVDRFHDNWIDGNGTENNRYIVCHIATSTVDLYRNDTLMGTYPMGSMFVAYGGTPYAIVADYYNVISQSQTTLTPAVTNKVNIEYNTTSYQYIKISEGISINNTSGNYYTEWTNAPYTNSDIQILFRATNSGQIYTNTLTTSNGDVITVSTDGTTTNVKINNEETVDVGHWRTFILDIDGLNGNVSVIPVKDFGTFTQYNTYDTSISVGAIDKGTITGLIWDNTTSSFKFLIVKTTVFMNTYGAVMVDPSIDISDYFTDLNNEYRLNYYSFALYGDAMTINGTEYTVENGRISIDDTEHVLRNIYITYNDGHTYITFNEDNTVLDLGETTDYTISFDGTWYFTNTLYKGFEKTETVYNWHWDGFNISWDAAILVFVGLSAIGVAYCAKHHMINTIGIIIVIVSGVCAISLIGGLI